MNLILNGDRQSRDQRPRALRKVAVEGLCGIAIGVLVIVAISAGVGLPRLPKATALVSALISFMALALIVFLFRRLWALPISTCAKSFSRIRRRIGVLSYFGGWFAVFLMLEVHSLH
jgi:hypothetical protein